MLTVLGGLAEFERHLILARTSDGSELARARGVRFGRKLKLTPHQRQEVRARRAAGEALVEIARSYAVSHSTISRLSARSREPRFLNREPAYAAVVAASALRVAGSFGKCPDRASMQRLRASLSDDT